MKKFILTITSILILAFSSGVTAGSCWNANKPDVDDCKVWAEQGNAVAQSNLGIIYQWGQGVPEDYKKSVYWYSKAAEQGHTAAQSNLGIMYASGKGVPEDYKKSVYWYGKAAEQGHASAQYNLGVMYFHGKGVPQDYVIAHMFFKIAGANGEKEGTKQRGLIAELMTLSQIAEAERLAGEWMQKHQ